MFGIVFNVLWVCMFAGSFYTGVKVFQLYFDLKRHNIPANEWNGRAKMKEMERLAIKTTNERVRQKAERLITYLTALRIIFWGGFGLIILLFLLNGIFKWKV